MSNKSEQFEYQISTSMAYIDIEIDTNIKQKNTTFRTQFETSSGDPDNS